MTEGKTSISKASSYEEMGEFWDTHDLTDYLDAAYIDWLVVGGESGPRARPMELDWARGLRDQCREAGVPFFLKQLGGSPKRGGDAAVLDGVRHAEYP